MTTPAPRCRAPRSAPARRLDRPVRPSPPTAKQRGVALGLFAEDVGFSYAPLLREIAALGATHVSLVVPFYQTTARSSDLAPAHALLADAGADRRHRAGRPARAPRGHGVPHHPPAAPEATGEWRGTLAPADRERLVPRLRRAAGRRGGDRRADGRHAAGGRQRAVVAGWRSRPLEPARRADPRRVPRASWCTRRTGTTTATRSCTSWSTRTASSPTFPCGRARRSRRREAALEAAWRRHKQDLLDWHAGREHPLVLTEVGYRSRAGSTAAPWDEGAGGTSRSRGATPRLRRVPPGVGGRAALGRGLRVELVRLGRTEQRRLHAARQTGGGRSPPSAAGSVATSAAHQRSYRPPK